jgi:hypothetical protein
VPAQEDDALIVPEGLDVTALAGGNGVLTLIALTLRRGARGLELFAALRNEGERPACDAALSVELFDQNEQSLAAGIGGLHSAHFYRLTDGSDSLAACVGPGEVSMAALRDWPAELALEDVGFVVYRCPYFALDVVPIAGLSLRQLKSARSSAGMAYTGTLVNELDVAVTNPSVTVFPVNRVGRPLGAALASATLELRPGGSWAFETDSLEARGSAREQNLDVPGADFVAYPAGALDLRYGDFSASRCRSCA